MFILAGFIIATWKMVLWSVLSDILCVFGKRKLQFLVSCKENTRDSSFCVNSLMQIWILWLLQHLLLSASLRMENTTLYLFRATTTRSPWGGRMDVSTSVNITWYHTRRVQLVKQFFQKILLVQFGLQWHQKGLISCSLPQHIGCYFQ